MEVSTLSFHALFIGQSTLIVSLCSSSLDHSLSLSFSFFHSLSLFLSLSLTLSLCFSLSLSLLPIDHIPLSSFLPVPSFSVSVSLSLFFTL